MSTETKLNLYIIFGLMWLISEIAHNSNFALFNSVNAMIIPIVISHYLIREYVMLILLLFENCGRRMD